MKLMTRYPDNYFELAIVDPPYDKSGMGGAGRIHPTQKPIKLYEWILKNYAKKGDKILDTHLGSGSIAIACHNLKFDLTACEIDNDYFIKTMERLKKHQAQTTLF